MNAYQAQGWRYGLRNQNYYSSPLGPATLSADSVHNQDRTQDLVFQD